MTFTSNFQDTVKKRIETDLEFRVLLLSEAINCFLNGEFQTGKAILRDYINATIGFQKLGILTSKSSKSLMRMLSDTGNPQAKNLFEIISHIQQIEGIKFEVQVN